MSKFPTSKMLNRYQLIMERIFFWHYQEGAREIVFERADMERAAQELGIDLPKNLGDVLSTFRYRGRLPESIRVKAPEGEDWIIRSTGRSHYRFVATTIVNIVPNKMLAETKVPDATPGVIIMYALGDQQALLAKLRYNRLIDRFTGVACYSLQNHLRTTVPNIGQVETDEIYVGIDRRGVHCVFPVQAKGGKDKFPSLICRPIAAQMMEDDLIGLFEFEEGGKGIAISSEKHYRLVPSSDISSTDLETYQLRSM